MKTSVFSTGRPGWRDTRPGPAWAIAKLAWPGLLIDRMDADVGPKAALISACEPGLKVQRERGTIAGA